MWVVLKGFCSCRGSVGVFRVYVILGIGFFRIGGSILKVLIISIIGFGIYIGVPLIHENY